MFETWGRILYRRRRLTLIATLVLVAFAAVWGTGVFGQLSSGNDFTPPASQSQRELDQAAQAFGRNDADVVVLYRSATMTVTDPAYHQAVTAALATLPRADVAKVTTYWSGGSSRLVSADRHATYAARPPSGCSARPTGGRRGRCAGCTPATGSRRRPPRRWPWPRPARAGNGGYSSVAAGDRRPRGEPAGGDRDESARRRA
ncbi:MAG: hypothetical protein ACRDPA_30635 [Solirubrobacteraceae bacterium]